MLLLRTDSSLSFLRSRTAVERLAMECGGGDFMHLIMLGGGAPMPYPRSFPVGEGGAAWLVGVASNDYLAVKNLR